MADSHLCKICFLPLCGWILKNLAGLSFLIPEIGFCSDVGCRLSYYFHAVQEAATICPTPCDLDLESGVQVTCDVGYLCANFKSS